MTAYESHLSDAERPPEPSQAQLYDLHATLLGFEPGAEPFEDIPPGVDHAHMTEYTAPPSYDETLAPSSVRRARDGQVLWLTTFRNPDTNAIAKQSVLIADPSLRDEHGAPVFTAGYQLTESTPGTFTISTMDDLVPVDAADVANLQELLDSSQPISLFGD